MKKFENIEIEMIKESFELRKKNSDTKHIDELNEISFKISLPIRFLTNLQRAIISGCIKEFVIYPNKEILNKSEYEIFLLKKEIEQDCLKIDIASRILNKIKKSDESKCRLFEHTFEKIEKLCNSKQIYYSITNDGKIYKIGIVTGNNEGMHIELCLTSDLENFKIGFLNKDSFMKSTNPTDLVKYLNIYEKKNRLTENQKRIIKLMEIAST